MNKNSPKNTNHEPASSKLLLTQALKLINAPLVVEERLELLAKIIAEYMGVDDVTIFLKDEDSDTIVLRASVGLDSSAVGKLRIPIGKGLTGKVAETGKYDTTRNILEDPRSVYSMLSEDEKYPSMLSFPIKSGEQLVGVVNIRTREERDFTEKEAAELNNFTATIAGSIQNAQVHERLEYKAHLLELSTKIANSVSSSLDLDVILEEVAWEIGNGFNIKGVVIHLMDEDGTITKTSSYGLKSSFLKNYPVDIAQSCLVSGEPKLRKIDMEESIGGFSMKDNWNICLPLMSREKSLGVISLFGIDDDNSSKGDLFLSTGVDVLLHIAGLAALAIENAMIHSKLRIFADEEKEQLDLIETMYSRISAVFDSISDGVIAVNGEGFLQDFNSVAKAMLGLTPADKGAKNIDAIGSYKPSLSSMIAEGKEFNNRVVTFTTSGDKIAAMATLKTFSDTSGEQKGSVISFRPMEETVKMLTRFSSQSPRYTFDDIIGHDTTLTETIKLAKLAAQSNSSILITGESGTGKELFSQAIHNASPVADGPFIALNCAAIPKDLIESELFGYEEGAFTGARKGGYIGKFEQATGGTLFLDEIGDMPLDLQVKLLRVLQEKVVQRVGSERIIPISARVTAATNRDLKKAIQEGTFREELFWRLNVITVEIPPLRERRDDIPELLRFFIKRFSESTGKDISDIEQESLKRLMDYSWRGNIRELENAIEHAVLISQSKLISWNDLPATLRERFEDEQKEVEGSRHESIEKAWKDRSESSIRLYKEAIQLTGGDVDKAADNLGMSRATLYRRLKKYNLTGFLSQLRHNIIPETQE